MIKHKIKTYLSVLLILTVVIACAVLLTGCGDDVEQIYVDKAHSPRLNYVQGQELDLQKGILTALVGKDKEESLIHMTDEGVSVTGYNKDTLGAQTLIVSYEGKTTTITVNVIPRITAEGYETSYFTGDAFKADKGKVKVAKDDAATILVSLNDPSVTIEGFDSSTAGEKTVTAKYSSGTDTYSCTFNVTVYDAATSTISIVYPKKTNYGSHETELDFTGGYITIKGGADGELEKHVDITKDMTTGYNPAVINAGAPEATQTITISYLGKTFQYSVKLKYSSVSIVKDNLQAINGIDLAAENLTFTEAQKNASWSAISEYLALKDTEKNFFSEDEVNTILRIASIAVSELYREELKEYEDTFIVISEGVQFVCETYEKTVVDLARLKDSSEKLNAYAAVLRSLLADHAELVVRGEKKVSDEVFVIPENIQKSITDILAHLISLHRSMMDIPDDWTVEKLIAMDNDSNQNNWAEPILYRIRVDIATAPYYKNGQGYIYTLLSKWREKDDFFEIVYSYFRYCYYNTEEEAISDVVSMLDFIPWPKTIDTWYSYWYTVMYISAYIEAVFKEDPSDVFMADLTEYNFYFKTMIDMANEINANKETDKLTAELYRLIAGDTRIRQARNKGYGMLKLKGFLTDENTGFSEVWSAYLELVELYAKGELIDQDGKIITQGYESKYEAVMNKICQLSPLELHEFLGSINFYYGKTDSDILALSIYTTEKDGETVSISPNTLATLMNAYYMTTFNDAEFEIYEKLLVAMESYARINKVASAKTTFMTTMAEVIDAYGDLADKTLFDSKMGTGYTAYLKLYNAAVAETNITVGTDALNHINKLLDAAVKLESIRDYIVAESAKPEAERSIRNEAYIVLFALYENARYHYLSLADMAEENEELRIALYHNIYEYDGSQLTVEQIFGKVGNHFWNYVINVPDITIVNGEQKYTYLFYDAYINSKLTNFLLQAADMLYAQFNESDLSGFSDTAVNNAFNAYAELEDAVIVILEALKTNELYFSFIESYMEDVVTDSATLTLSKKLVEVAKAYAKYQIVSSDENANSFTALVNAAEALKNLVTSTEDYDKYVKAIYEYYTSIEI